MQREKKKNKLIEYLLKGGMLFYGVLPFPYSMMDIKGYSIKDFEDVHISKYQRSYMTARIMKKRKKK